MNNFNRIFAVIKKHCGGVPSPEPCLGKIESEIEITNSMNPLYEYLDVLQDMGLIEYSVHTKCIILTEKGKQTEKLFTY